MARKLGQVVATVLSRAQLCSLYLVTTDITTTKNAYQGVMLLTMSYIVKIQFQKCSKVIVTTSVLSQHYSLRGGIERYCIACRLIALLYNCAVHILLWFYNLQSCFFNSSVFVFSEYPEPLLVKISILLYCSENSVKL